jgi:predicted amidophosphoribosyltransferase
VDERPRPAGFGNCARCAYVEAGTAAICFTCAQATFERLAANPCDTCERPLDPNGRCANPVCGWSEDDRGFRWVWAISMRTGALRHAIDRYKVAGKTGWSWIFGRVLVGYLDSAPDIFFEYDVIIPSPTYTGPGGRAFDHTGLVIEQAIVEDDGTWPFALDVIAKTKATTRFRGQPWQRRLDIATSELRGALEVRRPELVRGRRVLVFDDVYTEGLTIREVALALKRAGAVEVSEIVLARQPYQGSA